MRRTVLLTCAAGAGLAAAASGSAIAAKPGGGGGGTSAATIAAKPTTVTFGKPTTISGRVTGRDAAGAQVTLEQDAFPFGDGFAKARTVTAASTGLYTVPNVFPGVNSQYRVQAKTKPRATSGIVTVKVRPRVTLRVADKTPKRGQRVRFSGTVLPAHNGRVVLIQRRSSTGWKTVAKPGLKAATPVNGVARSNYSRRLKIRRSGTYRMRFVPGDGDHVRNTTRRHRLVVH